MHDIFKLIKLNQIFTSTRARIKSDYPERCKTKCSVALNFIQLKFNEIKLEMQTLLKGVSPRDEEKQKCVGNFSLQDPIVSLRRIFFEHAYEECRISGRNDEMIICMALLSRVMRFVSCSRRARVQLRRRVDKFAGRESRRGLFDNALLRTPETRDSASARTKDCARTACEGSYGLTFKGLVSDKIHLYARARARG